MPRPNLALEALFSYGALYANHPSGSVPFLTAKCLAIKWMTARVLAAVRRQLRTSSVRDSVQGREARRQHRPIQAPATVDWTVHRRRNEMHLPCNAGVTDF